MKYTLAILALAGVALSGQAINKGGVVNAASQASQALPSGAIAQGSVFLINGTNLGDTAQAGSPLDVQLNNTTVQVTVGGTTMAAPVVATSATQVTAIMPSGMATGAGTVVVTYNGTASPAAPVQVAATGFGIFTTGNGGGGPAQITDMSGNAISVANPAQPGQTVILSGTGLGASSTDDLSAPPMNDVSSSLSINVYVGVEQTGEQYAGRAGTTPGQDQIQFTIPGDAIQGCNVPVAVMVNNAPSNFASIAISASGACSDANGLSPSQVAQLQQVLSSGGTVSMAQVSVSRSTINLGALLPPGVVLPPGVPLPPSANTTDNGSATFAQFTAAQFGGAAIFNVASVGGCLVFSGSNPASLAGVLPTGLNAGPSISISGSKGNKQLMPTAGFPGSYSAQLGMSANGGQLYLDPGSFTASGSGGPDVGAFQVNLQMPPALTWPSPPTTVTRANGVTVNWTGGAANSFVTITGISTGGAAADGGTAPAAFFLCIAPASAQTFFVPPVVTLSLPATAASSGPASIPNGFMSLQNSAAPVPFSAPGITFGSASASSAVMNVVNFQ